MRGLKCLEPMRGSTSYSPQWDCELANNEWMRIQVRCADAHVGRIGDYSYRGSDWADLGRLPWLPFPLLIPHSHCNKIIMLSDQKKKKVRRHYLLAKFNDTCCPRWRVFPFASCDSSSPWFVICFAHGGLNFVVICPACKPSLTPIQFPKWSSLVL